MNAKDQKPDDESLLEDSPKVVSASNSHESVSKSGDRILALARRILKLGPICDHCLGRQFAMLSTGLTDAERGLAIKTILAMAADAAGGAKSREAKEVLADLAPSSRQARLRLGRSGDDERCWVCLGLMEPARLEKLANEATDELTRLEYDSFLVGTLMSGLLAENEEMLLADGGSWAAEPMKSELNREVGKLIAKKTGKAVDLKNPHIVVHLNLVDGKVDLLIQSLYISGRYRKLLRGFPQTRWPCRECGGSGCERCGHTGRMYQESVDELIRDPVIEFTRAEDTVFHGSGREDIDARMLGSGRPFVVEAVRPYQRSVDLAALREEINRRAAPKVEVGELSIADKAMVESLKDAAYDKTYIAKIEFPSEAGGIDEEKLKSVLNELVGSVEQRTPTRVAHRRADLVRTRAVYSAVLNWVSKEAASITVACESGLYVKELVSGDGGRTNPSLAALLGIDARVVELDVIDVGGVSDG